MKTTVIRDGLPIQGEKQGQVLGRVKLLSPWEEKAGQGSMGMGPGSGMVFCPQP